MLDDLDRLRQDQHLLHLLTHYVEAAQGNREVWVPRLMEIEGLGARDVAKLHGELIAFGWVEQNTGQTPCCYRLTPQGLRAIQLANGNESVDDVPEVPEETPVQKPKRMRSEGAIPEKQVA